MQSLVRNEVSGGRSPQRGRPAGATLAFALDPLQERRASIAHGPLWRNGYARSRSSHRSSAVAQLLADDLGVEPERETLERSLKAYASGRAQESGDSTTCDRPPTRSQVDPAPRFAQHPVNLDVGHALDLLAAGNSADARPVALWPRSAARSNAHPSRTGFTMRGRPRTAARPHRRLCPGARASPTQLRQGGFRRSTIAPTCERAIGLDPLRNASSGCHSLADCGVLCATDRGTPYRRSNSRCCSLIALADVLEAALLDFSSAGRDRRSYRARR